MILFFSLLFVEFTEYSDHFALPIPCASQKFSKLQTLVISPIVVETVRPKVVPIASSALTVVVEPLPSITSSPTLVIVLITSSSPSSPLIVVPTAVILIVILPVITSSAASIVIVPNLVRKRIRQHHARAGRVPRNVAHHLLLVLVDATAQLLKHAQIATAAASRTGAAAVVAGVVVIVAVAARGRVEAAVVARVVVGAVVRVVAICK